MATIKPLEKENAKVKGELSKKLLVIIALVLVVVAIGKSSVQQLQLGFTASKPQDTSNTIINNAPVSIPDTSWLMSQAQQHTGKVGEIAIQTGKDIGAAVLGEAVGLAEKAASKSADAAANAVIQSTVPGIVDQIDKLPESQQKEVKKIICE